MCADVDVAIVGAGAAGLSLAVRLVGSGLRVELLDPREGFSDDRTFSGFHFEGTHPFEAAIQHRYPAISLFSPRQGEVRHATGKHPYVRIAGDLFYAVALRRMAQDPRIRLTLATRVDKLMPLRDHVEIETSRGNLRAHVVVEAKGRFEPSAPAPTLLQVFRGLVVRTERPIFDPDRATLMDFRLPQQKGPHFMYVLPDHPRQALVEDTYFVPRNQRITEAEHDAAIGEWLHRHHAGAYEIVRHEEGVLPMSGAQPQPTDSPRVVRMGLAGGSAKGSTGYAFSFIQRHADALALTLRGADLKSALGPWPAHRSASASFLDTVFLRYALAEIEAGGSPGEVGEALVGLFRKSSLGVVARFLSERASPLDLLRVMAAMPTVPFVRAAGTEITP